MLELTFLEGLQTYLTVNITILHEVIQSIYCVSGGGVTMKNISRWTGPGGSYRSIQRLFASQIDWLGLNLYLIAYGYFGYIFSGDFLLAVDETVERKSRTKTWGVCWFYSSMVDKPIRSVSFHAMSLVSVSLGKSFTLDVVQNIKEPKKAPTKKVKQAKSGRPKGSKDRNKEKSDGLIYKGFALLLGSVLPRLSKYLEVKYVVADGSYGNKTSCIIAQEHGLELISKLNKRTGLYLPYDGPYAGRGRRRKYGKKIDYDHLPSQNLVSSTSEEGIRENIYQFKQVWTKHIPYKINVVIITKTDLESGKTARSVLFSTCPELAATTMKKYYRLRFQIEFDFRDAKQYFGLSDFKNVKERQLTNAVGIAFFMGNISRILQKQAKQKWQTDQVSIQDIKAYFRGYKYAFSIFNTLKKDQNVIFNPIDFKDTLAIGAINSFIK